jgi:hypothetical protein
MLMLLASLREVDEDEFTAIREAQHDVMVHIAEKCFLASKELVQSHDPVTMKTLI